MDEFRTEGLKHLEKASIDEHVSDITGSRDRKQLTQFVLE